MTSIADRMGLTDSVARHYMSYIDLNDADIERVTALRPEIERHADEIVSDFYAHIDRQPRLLEIIEGAGSSIERLKRAQRQYLLEVFGGDYGMAYIERRLAIGVMHNRIGLTPHWYLGSYSIYRHLLTPIVVAQHEDAATAMAVMNSVDKILSLDAQLAIETYNFAQLEDIREVSMSRDSLAASIQSYQGALARIAEGDLRETVEVDESDALADVGRSINQVTVRLAELASETALMVQSMATSVEEVQRVVSAQTVGATQQASAIAQTSSTLEEMRATSDQTLSRAQQLGETGHRIQTEGNHGLVTIGEVVQGMEQIREAMNGIAQTILSLSEQTQQIGDITNVVSNLAQQSKMLALNASIEAAKAGEAGRGFSVVAAEVRDLAEQSHQATAQVQRILQDIRHATDKAVMATESGTKGVNSGLDLVNTAGSVMESLMGAIEESSISSQQIVAAVQQEAQAIGQAATAVSEINEVTAQFVTTSEETRTAADDLGRLGDKLQELVQVYQLPENK